MNHQILLKDPNYIKKAKLNYRQCQAKGLHEGQQLSFVCIDPKCAAKGLICPVCRQKTHKDHNVMHIKYFLAELQTSLYQSSSHEDEMAQQTKKIRQSALAENLLRLEKSRKSIRNSLNDTVKSLAEIVKKIEEKIQENYIKVRNIILSQGSLQNKIPSIYRMLIINEGEPSKEYTDNEIQEQIKKCTNLMESKNNQPSIVDDSKKILDQYEKQTDTCITHLMGVVSSISDKIKELPLQLKSLVGLDKKSESMTSAKYKFSQQLKAKNLTINENGKGLSNSDGNIGGIGYAFIESQKSEESEGIRKIALKITGSVSDSISLGVGNSDVLSSLNFITDQMQVEQVYGICAMGINIVDMDSPSFVFSQGDIIQILLDEQTSKLTINRRNGVEKQQIFLGLTPHETKLLKFFVTLPIPGDCIDIIE